MAFLLENVKNLVSHDNGKTFGTITEILGKLGYNLSHRIISSENWVPQRRKRIFIVGIRKDLNKLFDFDELNIPQHSPNLSVILHPEDGSEDEEKPYTFGKSAAVSDKYYLSSKLWDYLKAYSEKHKNKGNGFRLPLFGPNDVARTVS